MHRTLLQAPLNPTPFACPTTTSHALPRENKHNLYLTIQSRQIVLLNLALISWLSFYISPAALLFPMD